MTWVCALCGAQWAPGAPRCPECPSTEHREVAVVPKILPNGRVTYESDVPREHRGTGVPMEAVEHPADGTWSPEVSNDGPGEPEPVAAADADVPAQDAVPAPEPAVHVPPRPPRRVPPPAGG